MSENITAVTHALAVDILRCPVVEDCLQSGGDELGCRRVASRYSTQLSPHYVPEPWSGHLARAPILFMSSNPGGGKHGEGVNVDGTCGVQESCRVARARPRGLGDFGQAHHPRRLV